MSTSKGQFRPGPDPRRHRFTREECVRGFIAAEASIARRFPGADPHFLMCAMIGSRPWQTLPQFRALLDQPEPPTEAQIFAQFAREY